MRAWMVLFRSYILTFLRGVLEAEYTTLADKEKDYGISTVVKTSHAIHVEFCSREIASIAERKQKKSLCNSCNICIDIYYIHVNVLGVTSTYVTWERLVQMNTELFL